MCADGGVPFRSGEKMSGLGNSIANRQKGLIFKKERDKGWIYVVTEQTPDTILDYAKDKFSEILFEHLSNNGISAEGKQFSLGSPINLQETGKH